MPGYVYVLRDGEVVRRSYVPDWVRTVYALEEAHIPVQYADYNNRRLFGQLPDILINL
jgi:hypothetical protein